MFLKLKANKKSCRNIFIVNIVIILLDFEMSFYLKVKTFFLKVIYLELNRWYNVPNTFAQLWGAGVIKENISGIKNLIFYMSKSIKIDISKRKRDNGN